MFTGLRRFRESLRPYRGQVLLILAGLVLESAFTGSVPLAVKFLVDNAIVPRDTRLLALILTALGAGAIVVAVVGLARDYLYAKVCAAVLRDLRHHMFTHLQRLTPADDRVESRDVAAHFTSDLAGVEHALTTVIPWAILPALDVAVCAALLFALEWRLALVAALVFPVSMAGPRIVAPRASRASDRRKEDEARVLGSVHEHLGLRMVIKAFGLEQRVIDAFSTGLGELEASSRRTAFLGALTERSATTGILMLHVLILGIGTMMTFNGVITVGTLVSFQSLFLTLSWSLSYMTQYMPNLTLAAAGMRRIEEFLAAESAVADAQDAQPLPRVAGEIVFEKVTFGLPGRRPILVGLSFTVRAGERVAIVGPVGSGKSTVLRLIARFVDPDDGRVLIDGHDLCTVTQASVRSRIGLVLQESFLFDVTARENIRMGKLDATDSEIEAAASLVGLHEQLETRRRGYETHVGLRGDNLSGGQRQLVAIARAVVRDPPILILDEATSALDPKSATVVQMTLDLVSRGRTVLSVTHDLASARHADRVLVLENGRLAESGSHEALLAGGGVYAGLWRKQQEQGTVRERFDGELNPGART